MQKHNNSGKKSEPTTKRAKSRGPVQRDTKEVLAELVGKLKEKLDPKKAAGASAGDGHPRGELRPNLDRLTVGVDLGDHADSIAIEERFCRGDWPVPKTASSAATIGVSPEVIQRILRLKTLTVEVRSGLATRKDKLVKSDDPGALVFQSVQDGRR